MTTTIAKEQQSKPKIQKWEHTDFGLEIPYYDEELGMSQSEEHEIAINYLSYVFKFIAKDLGIKAISDHPVWYLEPPVSQTTKIEQKAYYPDLCFSRNMDVGKIGADDLILALEVVSTERKDKELKDEKKMKSLNVYNGVLEFILVYPKVSDSRVIKWYYLKDGDYIPIERDTNGVYHSKTVEGLSILELPRDDWREGAKIEVLYKGRVLVSYEEVWEIVEEEKRRADKAEIEKKQEKQRADRAESERKQEKQRADKAEIEKKREKQRADKEKLRADRAESERELYIRKLKELGIDPDKL